MRSRSPWVLIGLAVLIILYAMMRLVEISRNQESVIETAVFLSVTAQEVHTDEEFMCGRAPSQPTLETTRFANCWD